MRASGYKRAPDSWYVEPSWAVDALLDVETFTGSCCDPACGSGTIPKAMQARGILCSGSDIADRGFGEVADFLATTPRFRNYISNPPFDLMRDFIDHALEVGADKVAMLGRLAFLEGQERKLWWPTVPFARLWVSSRRISMPPGGTDIPARGGSTAYAWYVFERGYDALPVVGWI